MAERPPLLLPFLSFSVALLGLPAFSSGKTARTEGFTTAGGDEPLAAAMNAAVQKSGLPLPLPSSLGALSTATALATIHTHSEVTPALTQTASPRQDVAATFAEKKRTPTNESAAMSPSSDEEGTTETQNAPEGGKESTPLSEEVPKPKKWGLKESIMPARTGGFTGIPGSSSPVRLYGVEKTGTGPRKRENLAVPPAEGESRREPGVTPQEVEAPPKEAEKAPSPVPVKHEDKVQQPGGGPPRQVEEQPKEPAEALLVPQPEEQTGTVSYPAPRVQPPPVTEAGHANVEEQPSEGTGTQPTPFERGGPSRRGVRRRGTAGTQPSESTGTQPTSHERGGRSGVPPRMPGKEAEEGEAVRGEDRESQEEQKGGERVQQSMPRMPQEILQTTEGSICSSYMRQAQKEHAAALQKGLDLVAAFATPEKCIDVLGPGWELLYGFFPHHMMLVKETVVVFIATQTWLQHLLEILGQMEEETGKKRHAPAELAHARRLIREPPHRGSAVKVITPGNDLSKTASIVTEVTSNEAILEGSQMRVPLTDLVQSFDPRMVLLIDLCLKDAWDAFEESNNEDFQKVLEVVHHMQLTGSYNSARKEKSCSKLLQRMETENPTGLVALTDAMNRFLQDSPPKSRKGPPSILRKGYLKKGGLLASDAAYAVEQVKLFEITGALKHCQMLSVNNLLKVGGDVWVKSVAKVQRKAVNVPGEPSAALLSLCVTSIKFYFGMGFPHRCADLWQRMKPRPPAIVVQENARLLRQDLFARCSSSTAGGKWPIPYPSACSAKYLEAVTNYLGSSSSKQLSAHRGMLQAFEEYSVWATVMLEYAAALLVDVIAGLPVPRQQHGTANLNELRDVMWQYACVVHWLEEDGTQGAAGAATAAAAAPPEQQQQGQRGPHDGVSETILAEGAAAAEPAAHTVEDALEQHNLLNLMSLAGNIIAEARGLMFAFSGGFETRSLKKSNDASFGVLVTYLACNQHMVLAALLLQFSWWFRTEVETPKKWFHISLQLIQGGFYERAQYKKLESQVKIFVEKFRGQFHLTGSPTIVAGRRATVVLPQTSEQLREEAQQGKTVEQHLLRLAFASVLFWTMIYKPLPSRTHPSPLLEYFAVLFLTEGESPVQWGVTLVLNACAGKTFSVQKGWTLLHEGDKQTNTLELRTKQEEIGDALRYLFFTTSPAPFGARSPSLSLGITNLVEGAQKLAEACQQGLDITQPPYNVVVLAHQCLTLQYYALTLLKGLNKRKVEFSEGTKKNIFGFLKHINEFMGKDGARQLLHRYLEYQSGNAVEWDSPGFPKVECNWKTDSLMQERLVSTAQGLKGFHHEALFWESTFEQQCPAVRLKPISDLLPDQSASSTKL